MHGDSGSWGLTIGRYPLPTIAICFALTGVFGGGLYYFYEETRPGNLWVPGDSLAQTHRQWITDNYPADYLRFESIIVEADNVLDPTVFSAILDLDLKVKAIDEGDGVTWENVCARLGAECWSNSVLELWSFNSSVISQLTSQDIINTVNSLLVSPVYQVKFEVTRYLGELTKDSEGRIVGAKAANLRYVVRSNASRQEELAEGNVRARRFEDGFLRVGEQGHSGVKAVYYSAQRSQPDVGSGAIFGDLNILFAGFALIFVFVSLALGKFNMVHQRVFLAISGIMCVGFAALVSIGIASYADIFFGPLHNILPFLLLGIGVDDMFVIVQAWEVTKAQTEGLPMPERVGEMMRNAGVSITVTSLTDILAFGIGATTRIPALRSFCIYACVGILAIYLFQATFFVACLSLDNRRAGSHRNACCCCYVHKDYKPNECSQREFVQGFFDRILGKLLTRIPVKVLVIVLAAGLFAPAVYGVTQLEQNFDPDWFIPKDTYYYDYLEAQEKFFPEASAIPGAVYIGEIDYYEAFPKLVQLHKDMESSDTIQTGSVLSWYYFFDMWLQSSGLNVSSTTEFYTHLHSFLFTDPATSQHAPGAAFLRDIVFNDDNVTSRDRHIRVSKVQFEHTSLENAAAEIAAMQEMRSLTSDLNLQDVFPYSFFYLVWEGNMVIREELFRNIGLAFLCVFLMTLILIAHPWTCFLVCSCVIATLVDVGGLIYFWGLTIDTVTSINLILAVGLAVDYAAHIGHAFMTVRGSRNDRTVATLSRMGPAVFYGGFSTFLAFVLLAGSDSYVFSVFFKVFFGVVLFGLFHGLVFLPVLLSLLGPAPYLSQKELQEESKESDAMAHTNMPHDPVFQGSMLGAGTINSGFLADATPNAQYPQASPTHNNHGNSQPEDTPASQPPQPWRFYHQAPSKPANTSSPASPQTWGANVSSQPVQWPAYPQYAFTMPHLHQASWSQAQGGSGSHGNTAEHGGHKPQKNAGKKRKGGAAASNTPGYYGNGYYPGAMNGYSMSLGRFYK